MTFRVTLKPSGRTFEVAKGERILTAAIRSGVSLPYSCRQGACETCLSRVTEGTVEMPASITLAASERAKGMTLLCVAIPSSDVVVEATEIPPTSAPFVGKTLVRALRKASPEIMILEMKLPITTPIRFHPGQYIDLLLPDGIRRSYSLANAPIPEGDIDLELHISLIPGGRFTERLFSSSVQERERMGFEGPLGTFFIRNDSEKPIVLMATGTGYAPIRSIIQSALTRGSRRTMTFYWGGRTKEDLYLLDEAMAWSEANDWLKVIPVLSAPASTDNWRGRTGLVHRAVIEDFPTLANYQVYAAGPASTIQVSRIEFTSRCGLPKGEFFAQAYLTEADLALKQSNH